MPESCNLAPQRRPETPLLGLDNDHAMTEFWSPRRPPMAPPSSPKLDGSNPDLGGQQCPSSHHHTLAYLNKQLENRVSQDESRHCQLVSFNRPSRRFSWQTDCSSSDEDCTAEDLYAQQTPIPDEDGATLVNVSSTVRSSCSEANTICGDLMDSSHPFSAHWKQSLSKLDYIPGRAWSATVPFRGPTATRANITQRLNPPTFHTPDYRASCPSYALSERAISPPAMRSTRIDPTPSLDMRAHSWPGFTDGTYSAGLASPMPPEPSEKSSWDPDSSDDDKEASGREEQSLGKLRRQFGRRVSDTLRPLFCRS